MYVDIYTSAASLKAFDTLAMNHAGGWLDGFNASDVPGSQHAFVIFITYQQMLSSSPFQLLIISLLSLNSKLLPLHTNPLLQIPYSTIRHISLLTISTAHTNDDGSPVHAVDRHVFGL